MVFYTPPLQRPPAPVTAPVKDRHVSGVNRIEPRDRREDDGRGKRSLRHRLIDLVMDEVDGIPDLSPPQKQRIRHSLDRFADQHKPDQQKPEQKNDQPPPPPPSPEQAAEVMANIVAADPVPHHDGIDAVHLAAEMRRIMALHTDRAVKIVSYLHALMAVTPDSHQVDLDI